MRTYKVIGVYTGLVGLWVASGYLIYEYVFPVTLAYFVFPFICFGVIPNIREILWVLVVLFCAVVVFWGAGGFLQSVLHFPVWLAYSTLPGVLVATCLLDKLLLGEEDNKGDRDGIS